MSKRNRSAGIIAVLGALVVVLIVTSLAIFLKPPTDNSAATTTGTTVDWETLPEDLKERLKGQTTTATVPVTSPTTTAAPEDPEVILQKIRDRSATIRAFHELTKITQILVRDGAEEKTEGEIYMDIYPQAGNALRAMGSEDGTPIFLMKYGGEVYRAEGSPQDWVPYELQPGELEVTPHSFYVDLATHPLMTMVAAETAADPIELSWSGYDADILDRIKSNYKIELSGFAPEEIRLDVTIQVSPEQYDITSQRIRLVASHGGTEVDATFETELSKYNNLRELSSP